VRVGHGGETARCIVRIACGPDQVRHGGNLVELVVGEGDRGRIGIGNNADLVGGGISIGDGMVPAVGLRGESPRIVVGEGGLLREGIGNTEEEAPLVIGETCGPVELVFKLRHPSDGVVGVGYCGMGSCVSCGRIPVGVIGEGRGDAPSVGCGVSEPVRIICGAVRYGNALGGIDRGGKQVVMTVVRKTGRVRQGVGGVGQAVRG